MFCWPEQQEVEGRDAKGTSRQSDDDRIEQGSVMETQVWFFLHLGRRCFIYVKRLFLNLHFYLILLPSQNVK